MKTYAKIYIIDSQIYIDVPLLHDMFFPFGRPNDEYIFENGYKLINESEFTKEQLLNNQIVYGTADISNDYNNMKVKREFKIEKFLTIEEYKNE